MITLLFFIIHIAYLQQSFETMLGKSKLEIQQTMANKYNEYSSNNFGIKSNDNTLRYYNSKTDATIIFYFTPQQKCKLIKSIEDIENLNKRTQEFNTTFAKVSPYKWKTTVNQKTVNISIEKDEYNFSIIYQ